LPRVLSIAPGEKLLVRSNFLPGKLKNGDLVTVEQVKDDGGLVLRDGRTIPAHFRQFTHGYATTSHAAQGKTVDHGILILGEKGFQAANLKQAYVSNSRFRQSQTVFTVDKEAAFNAMGKEAERSLATEAVHPEESLAKEPAVKIKPAQLEWSPTIGSHSVSL
jgi:ATP-dependent exoDNAse (exonuclease V) alpha subunit